MVAMLLRFAGLTLAAAVVLPEVLSAQALHGTGPWHQAAGLCASGASRVARSEQRHLSLLDAHRGGQRGRRPSSQSQNHHAGMAEGLEMWP